MVDIIFSNNKLHRRDSKLAENKKCPIQGLLPDGLIVSIELDRVGLRNCFVMLPWYYIKLCLKSQYPSNTLGTL